MNKLILVALSVLVLFVSSSAFAGSKKPKKSPPTPAQQVCLPLQEAATKLVDIFGGKVASKKDAKRYAVCVEQAAHRARQIKENEQELIAAKKEMEACMLRRSSQQAAGCAQPDDCASEARALEAAREADRSTLPIRCDEEAHVRPMGTDAWRMCAQDRIRRLANAPGANVTIAASIQPATSAMYTLYADVISWCGPAATNMNQELLSENGVPRAKPGENPTAITSEFSYQVLTPLSELVRDAANRSVKYVNPELADSVRLYVVRSCAIKVMDGRPAGCPARVMSSLAIDCNRQRRQGALTRDNDGSALVQCF